MATDCRKLVRSGDEVACADWVIILCYVEGALLQVRTVRRIDETRRSGNRGRWSDSDSDTPGSYSVHLESSSVASQYDNLFVDDVPWQ